MGIKILLAILFLRKCIFKMLFFAEMVSQQRYSIFVASLWFSGQSEAHSTIHNNLCHTNIVLNPLTANNEQRWGANAYNYRGAGTFPILIFSHAIVRPTVFFFLFVRNRCFGHYYSIKGILDVWYNIFTKMCIINTWYNFIFIESKIIITIACCIFSNQKVRIIKNIQSTNHPVTL